MIVDLKLPLNITYVKSNKHPLEKYFFLDQGKSSCKTIEQISTKRPLELLHIDLFGPIQTASLSGKRYGFVIVDDFSRFTWVLFLKHKDEYFEAFQNFCKAVRNEKGSNIISLRSDHG